MWSYSHGGFAVHQIPVLQDNYIYLIETKDVLACVDPAESAPVEAACGTLGRTLTHILNTHHHWDHVGGNPELKARYGCAVIGSSCDAERIPGLDMAVDESAAFRLGRLNVSVLFVPGHTRGHIAFLIEDALFCGDTLFGAGCGRLFEGTPEQMWSSLVKIMRLPGATRFYCAHEYTLNNLAFCIKHVAHSEAVRMRLEREQEKRRRNLPTIPGRLDEERTTNPFMLVADNAFRLAYAEEHDIGHDPVSVFAHIRAARDRW